MRLWYDPSGGVHGINTANWFAEHVGLAYPTDCTFHEIPPPLQIAQRLPGTPGLLELLPVIRHGRADLIVQVDENDNHEDWIENQIILVIEVTAESPHGHNFWQRTDKFVPSARLRIPTAYILPQKKTTYKPTRHQRPVFGMMHDRYGVPVMHVLWPATDEGVLLVDPTPAWAPDINPNTQNGYWGEPLVQDEVENFINQCIDYLVNYQQVSDAFADQITRNEQDFAIYQNRYVRGNNWGAHREIQQTTANNVGQTAHQDVLARGQTLVIGPATASDDQHFMRRDPYTGTILFAEEWCSINEQGCLEMNTVLHWGDRGIQNWNDKIADYMNVHSEHDVCPFHDPSTFTPATAATHMQEEDPSCPFSYRYEVSKWLTLPHAVIFPDAVWVSPYRR